MGKTQKKSVAVSRQPRPRSFNNLPLGTAKIQNFLQEPQFAIDVFFFLGNCRSGWPLEVAACHVPSVEGGAGFFRSPPRLRNAHATPFNEKNRKPFYGTCFPACAHRLVAVVNLPHLRVPLLQGKNVKHCPLRNSETPQTPNAKKFSSFFPPYRGV